jgi:hypothetical protein
LSTGATGKLLEFDVEASGVGGVGDTYFLAFWVDVSVAADLVAETVTEVAGGLSGVSVAEAGLTQLVLCVVLCDRERRVAVSEGIDNGDGCSCGHSGVVYGGADASERKGPVIYAISTVSEELSFGGNSQHQQTGNLCEEKNKRIVLKYLKKKFF